MIFLKQLSAVFLDFYFVRGFCRNYYAFGSHGKIYLSPQEALEKSWKIVSEKGYEPCNNCIVSLTERP